MTRPYRMASRTLGALRVLSNHWMPRHGRALFAVVAILATGMGVSGEASIECPTGTEIHRTHHPDGSTSRIRCLRPDGVAIGPFVLYHRNGLPAVSGTYADLRHRGLLAPSHVGTLTKWHSNGELYAKISYPEGLADGRVRYFDRSGRYEYTTVFDQGHVVDRYDGDRPHEIECPPGSTLRAPRIPPHKSSATLSKSCERWQPPVGAVFVGPFITIDKHGQVASRCERQAIYEGGSWIQKSRCKAPGEPFGEWQCGQYFANREGTQGVPCPE